METVAGHDVPYHSTFTRADGSQSGIHNVFFQTDRANTLYSGVLSAAPETQVLPNLRGYGTLADLDIAMSHDQGLFELVYQFNAMDAGTAVNDDAAIELILYRWAGADMVAPDARSPYFDARKLAVLEAVMGRPLFDPDRPDAELTEAGAASLDIAWERYFQYARARLLAQGPLSGAFPDLEYQTWDDTLTMSGAPWEIPLGELLLSGDSTGEEMLGGEEDELLFGLAGNDSLDGGAGDDALIGGDGDDILTDTSGNNALFGGTGNDQLSGSTGNPNFFHGGTGDDTLTGGYEDDTYRFNLGDGHDRIHDRRGYTDAIDRLVLGEGLTPDSVHVGHDGNHLTLEFAGTNDRIIIEDWFSTDPRNEI